MLLDSDVAELYEVETREINQAVKNNPEKFPEGYILTLSKEEKNEVIKNFDNLKMIKYYPQPPKVLQRKDYICWQPFLKEKKQRKQLFLSLKPLRE